MAVVSKKSQGEVPPPESEPELDTPSGLPVKAIYRPEDGVGAGDYDEHVGDPGSFPFTRGIDPELYRRSPWIMGMYSGYATPAETNRRFKQLLERGQTGFSVALDLPTQIGLDSDDPLAAGEVGKVGVPINSLRDMETLLDGIPLEKVRQIRTSANSIGPVMTAMFIAAAEKHGLQPTQFRVMLQNDSLKEYVARGTYIFPPRQGLRFSSDVVEYCARNIPNWEPIEFCGYHLRDSGCNAIQEVAIALANGIAYIDEVLRRGVAIDDFAPSLVVFLSSDVNILEEVAKFRATRRIWARMMRDRFGATRLESTRLSIFCYTLGGALTAQEPLNNVIRVAYEALAAALGGVQTLATSSYDEALNLPSEEASTLALRTQQILAYETGVTSTVDPLGGSYFLESLTDELEARILKEIDSVQSAGGAVAAIENGHYAALIADSAYRLQMGIETGERVKVGVNKFSSSEPVAPRGDRSLKANLDLEAEQVRGLQELRRTRDTTAWSRSLLGVQAAARSDSNLVPSILEAVRSYATLGEICGVLREIWGEHRQGRGPI